MTAVGRRWMLMVLVGWLVGWAPLVAATSPPTGTTPDRALLFGVAGHAWWLDEHLDTFVAAYRDLGVTTVRLSIDWKYVEPTPGVYRWDRYDRVLGRLVDEHLTIVGVFVTVPAWAASDPAACAVEIDEPRVCDLPIGRVDAFEQVARAVLTRYPFIRQWEFGNEPELWTHLGRDVGDYLPWLARFYAIAKEVDPDLQVAASTLAGWEYIEWLYNTAEAILGPGARPWDAVAFHPYNTYRIRDDRGEEFSLRIGDIERLRAGMVARGDGHKLLWLTEYGWDNQPTVQATHLRRAMRWMQAQDYIAMAHLHMLHDWERERYGLMRAVPDVVGVRPVDATTRFVPKEPYYGSFRDLRRPDPPARPAGRAFPATGQVVAPPLLAAWEAGGREPYGAPLTRAFWERQASGAYALVQYFERGRLETTRATGARAGLLGDEALRRRGWLDAWGQPLVEATRPRPAPTDAEALYFPETGHGLTGPFRLAWEAAGGLPVLGYPRTDVLAEEAPDGSSRLVQYTQRGRLEQMAAPSGDTTVWLAPLGREAAQARGWLDTAGQPRPDYLNPARRSFI